MKLDAEMRKLVERNAALLDDAIAPLVAAEIVGVDASAELIINYKRAIARTDPVLAVDLVFPRTSTAVQALRKPALGTRLERGGG